MTHDHSDDPYADVGPPPEEHGAIPASSVEGIPMIAVPVERARIRLFTAQESREYDAMFPNLDLEVDEF